MRARLRIVLVVAVIVVFALLFPKDEIKRVLASIGNRIGDVVADIGYPTDKERKPEQEVVSETSLENCGIRLTFIDVGQGDATLIECDGETLLVDGGTNEYSDTIYSVLTSRGIENLSVVSTHGHLDHCGGLSAAFYASKVGAVYVPTLETFNIRPYEIFLEKTEEAGLTPTVLTAGDEFNLGSSAVKVLAPSYIDTEGNINNTSLVLKVVYGNTSFLLMGDAELEEIDTMLEAGYDVSCDVIRLGHHGSTNGNSYQLLYEAYPSSAVISVGKNNQYRHPTEKTLSRLRDAEIKCYRTDMQGDITCVSDGENISFSVEKNLDADTYSNAGSRLD